MKLIKPRPVSQSATMGIFSPSSPAYNWANEVYEHAIQTLKGLGFSILEGSLTASRSSQGYRSGTPQERAEEFMELIVSPEVDCMMATIGGFNSSSLIPYLDFELIRQARKPVVGYSDVTSLHLAILHYSGLSTFYGPAVVPSFGEYPKVLDETLNSFLDATSRHVEGSRLLEPPKSWSNHRRDWLDGSWKQEKREFEKNDGWRTVVSGKATARVIVANLNTLTSLAGCPFFPILKDKILLIEDEEAPLSLSERRLRQLALMGVFDRIAGLIVSKPERFNAQGAPFSYEKLLLEILPSSPSFPVITNFDCGHTHPMLTLAQGTLLELSAETSVAPRVRVLEPMVDVS